MRKLIFTITALVVLFPTGVSAQRVLTLDECREMAVEGDRSLQQARTKIEMAGYDRKIAFANYLPNVSGTGAYLHNPNDVSTPPPLYGTPVRQSTGYRKATSSRSWRTSRPTSRILPPRIRQAP